MSEALAESHTRGGGLLGPRGQVLKLTIGACMRQRSVMHLQVMLVPCWRWGHRASLMAT